MRRTVAGLTLVLALALPLSACSPDHSGSGTAAVAAEGKLDKAAAAQRWAQVTDPYEKVMASYHTAHDGGQPLEMQTGLASATANALRARVQGLRATTWPDDVAANVKKIADADEKAAKEWDAAAAAKTADEAYDDAGKAMALNTLPEIDTVKSALGVTSAS